MAIAHDTVRGLWPGMGVLIDWPTAAAKRGFGIVAMVF